MDQYKNSHSEGNSRLWLSIAIVVALTVAAILMVPDDAPEQMEEIPVPNQAPGPAPAAMEKQEETPSPGNGTEKAAVEETETSPPQGPEGTAARAFLASAGASVTPAQLVARAREFQQQGLSGDAWLLYFKAAREGDADAAMALAEQADPAFHDPETSALAEPDLVQAHKWYRLAEKAGSPEAPARIRRLLQHLQQAAEGGDERAALLLQEWKTK